ncbi:BrnA antitoxin family protein [Bradyrhizobium sp.]|uniref:BrnA antitoxin family protein n=1 Tax=Bradyrhizobium sp. TaxID=376 RepID=UPI003F8D6F23
MLVVHTWPEETEDGELIGASSALARPPHMKGKPMKKGASKRLTPKQRAELKSLASLRDNAIDTSDAPEFLDWSGAKRGLFYRPVKQQLTLRLDADVLAWFKSHATSDEGYQTRINRALREYVQQQVSRGRRSRA